MGEAKQRRARFGDDLSAQPGPIWRSSSVARVGKRMIQTQGD